MLTFDSFRVGYAPLFSTRIASGAIHVQLPSQLDSGIKMLNFPPNNAVIYNSISPKDSPVTALAITSNRSLSP